MTENEPNKILQQYEEKSITFEMFEQKIKAVNQNIVHKINAKKIEHYCDKPLDTRKRQIINTLCSNLHEKLGPIMQREINKILQEYKIQENFKKFDYIVNRNKLFKQIGKDPTEVFDEEEQYLDDLKEYLTDYYNKM